MSSKRKSPPTKLEGGCQPTTTTTTIAHTNLATLNQKSSNLDKDTTAHIKHSDSEHFTEQDTDCDIGEDLGADIDNNDHNNNDDDANDHCDSVNVNTLSTDGFDGKSTTQPSQFFIF